MDWRLRRQAALELCRPSPPLAGILVFTGNFLHFSSYYGALALFFSIILDIPEARLAASLDIHTQNHGSFDKTPPKR